MKRFGLAIVGLLMLAGLGFCRPRIFGTITGTVQDSAGRLCPARSSAYRSAGPSVGSHALYGQSRRFFFENLLPGEYLVQVTMPRFAASQKEKIQLESGAGAHVKFTLHKRGRSAEAGGFKRCEANVGYCLDAAQFARGTQSVLRYADSVATPVFGTPCP